MQQLLSDRHATFNLLLLRELFLQCLAPHFCMILAANAELALPTVADLAYHVIDTVTLTVANVIPPLQHITQLQS